MNINWYSKAFSNLTPGELYQLMRLRSEVFVVEQDCVFLDADNKDQQCIHFMGWIENDLVAYTRIAPPGYIYEEASIGRVVTSPAHRGNKIGYLLMEKSIEECTKHFGSGDIKIGAQYYLKSFYASFGFKQISDIYLEDGIEHIYMLLEDKALQKARIE